MTILVSALTAHSGNVGVNIPDHMPEVQHPDESAKPSAIADETISGKESTVTVKLLRVVRDSASGFGPLKSVAGGLCLVLENCKVWPPSHRFGSQHLQSS